MDFAFRNLTNKSCVFCRIGFRLPRLGGVVLSIGRIENVDNKKEYVRYATLGGSGGQSGIQIGNVQDLTLEEGSENLILRWKDPEDVVFNGETIGKWAGTKVVRKEGGSPGSVEDGTLVVDNAAKDQYAVNGFLDSDVATDIQYGYTLFPYTDKNIYTMSDKNKINGKLLEYKYGLNNNTWENIIEICRQGLATRYFQPGEKKDGYTIVGINHDEYADGSGKAPVTFACGSTITGGQVGTVNHGVSMMWGETLQDDNYGEPMYYKNSLVFKYLQNLYEGKETNDSIPDVLRKEIKPVVKKCIKNVKTGETEDIVCNLFLASVAEIGEGVGGYLTESYLTEGTEYEWFMSYNALFWTRTPYLHGANLNYAWAKYNTGDYKLEFRGVTQKAKARFCFCI